MLEYFNDGNVTNHHGFVRKVQNDQLFDKRTAKDLNGLAIDYGKAIKSIGVRNIRTSTVKVLASCSDKT